jgi:hypothetical protein
MARQWHRWTDEERQIVRRDYKGNNASAEAIARYLSALTGDRITIWAVRGQVQKLGIAKIMRKNWDPEEDERLAELISTYPPAKVAKMMHRGINSVVLRAKRLGCSRRARNGWFTKKDVCGICGVDHHIVQRWIDQGLLKASWHNDRRPQKDGSAYWHIEEKDFKRFVCRYPGELQGRNVDLIVLVDILVGVGVPAYLRLQK